MTAPVTAPVVRGARPVAGVLALGVLVLAGLARPVAAQAVRQAPALSRDGARQVLDAAEAEAARLGRTTCVVVVDPGGEPIVVARADGVLPVLCDVARAKARTAARYGRPSRAWAELLGRGNGGAMIGVPDMFAVEGGVPVLADGVVVGAVGVSGASAAEDGVVAQAGAGALGAARTAAR